MRGWLETFANPHCAAVPRDDRDAFLDEVTACEADGGVTLFMQEARPSTTFCGVSVS
jgi:hypothetical protein